MYTRFIKNQARNLCFALLMLAAVKAPAPVPFATLTVSPSMISNTYPGNITLNIGGNIGSGAQVTVQKWIDLNGNGVIDPGDLLMDQFGIADGGAMVIGGVTNVSAPYDSNPTSGAITTALNFAPPLTVENIVAHEIYRVISQTGSFSPVTATFTVTNAPTTQAFIGTVYSNGVAPVPYALVVALPQNGYAGATVADANGNYALNLDPGTYNVAAVSPGYYYNQSTAPQVTLTNGLISSNNLTLIPGTVTISGQFYNAANTNSVAGVALTVQSGHLLAFTFTDTNGNYTATVSSNFWNIKPIKERLARRAFVVNNNGIQIDATAGSVTNANVPLYKGTALYYGRVTDGNGNPLANIRVDSGDGTNNLYNAVSYTDTNGYFGVVSLGGVSTNWSCQANDSDNAILANYIVNSQNYADLSVGQALLQNFIALPVTATISGHVQINNGSSVPGVALYAAAMVNGFNYTSQNVETDGSGNYSMGVSSGAWGVNFSYGGNSGLDTLGLVDYNAPHNVSIPPTNVTLNITVVTNAAAFVSQPQRVSGSQFNLNILGRVGTTYNVQVSTNLAKGPWMTIYTLMLTNSPTPIIDPNATNNQRYYRAVEQGGG